MRSKKLNFSPEYLIVVKSLTRVNAEYRKAKQAHREAVKKLRQAREVWIAAKARAEECDAMCAIINEQPGADP